MDSRLSQDDYLMKNKELIDLLADHADLLNGFNYIDGFDSAAWLSERLPSKPDYILVLLQLAQSIKKTLVPVPVPTHLNSKIQQLLNQEQPNIILGEKRPFPQIFLLSAVAVGLIFILLRHLYLGQNQSQSQPATPSIL